MSSLQSKRIEDIKFVLLEDENHLDFKKYKDMFENSKIKEDTTYESYYNYTISIKDFDSLLYDSLEKYSKTKIPYDKISISSYKNSNVIINIINNTIEFKNNIDIKDILEQLKIILNVKKHNNSESEIRIYTILYKVIKQQCIIESIPEVIKSFIKYPIMFTEIETPIVLGIDITNNKIVGYVNYKDIKRNSTFIEFIEVNPDYRNMSICKNMVSYLISQKPNILKYELMNVGGLSGYSCYVDAFELNKFNIKAKFTNKTIKKTNINTIRILRKTNKLNLTKLVNQSINHKFNCKMQFIRV